MENLVTAQRVAEYLGISPLTVDKLVKNNGLPCSRIGTLKRYDMELVTKWAREQVNAPAPAPRNRKEKGKEEEKGNTGSQTDMQEGITDFV